MKPFLWLLSLAACRERTEKIEDAFADAFDDGAVGAHWHSSGPYRILGGRLNVSFAYNHPLWLARRLPRDAEIRFEAEAKSIEGDIKVELWGDGQSHATSKGAYRSTGYVLIHGGWKNRLTVLARLDEHGPDRLERRDLKVDPHRVYRWRIERRASRLKWWIDDQLVHEFEDPEPLAGVGHEHFAFNNWESDIYFDNLTIRRLP